MIVITGPSITYVKAIESAPFSGVATRNETVDAFEAPDRRSWIAVGRTLHEHRGNGVPTTAAFRTG
jgi:hypothetical protein